MMERRTLQLTRFAVLTSLALALSLMETLLIPDGWFPIPGLRLGLANMVTLLIVTMYGIGPAFIVLLVRSIIVFAFSGNITAFILSLCGGTAAILAMYAASKCRYFSIFSVSVAGAAAHHAGQIIAAAILTGTISVVSYMPLLLAASLPTGTMIALLCIPVYKALTHRRPADT